MVKSISMQTKELLNNGLTINSTSNKVLQLNDEVGDAIYKLKQSELDRIRLKKLTSSYVDGGFHQDKLCITEAIFYESGGYMAFEMEDYFMPSDGEFHLSSLLAETCLLHAGVVYSHVDNGLTVKQYEVYLRSIQFNFKKPIRDTNFSLEFDIKKKHRKVILPSIRLILTLTTVDL